MLQTLLVLLPFAFAGAVSPMVLTEQTVILASAGGRKVALRYGAGAILTLFLFVAVLVIFGRAISLPTELGLSAGMDIGIGFLLVLLAAFLAYRGRVKAARPPKPKKARTVTAGTAFGFGVIGMGTNLTTLAVMVPAAKIIASSGLGDSARLILTLVVVFIAAIPVWLPILLTWIAPGPAERFLDGLGTLLRSHGRTIVVVLLLALGIYMVVRGFMALP